MPKTKRPKIPVRLHLLPKLRTILPRSKQEQANLIVAHPRYNRSLSVNIKVHGIIKPPGWEDVNLYRLLERRNYWHEIGFETLRTNFESVAGGSLSISTDGSSGGYLVLVNGKRTVNPHKSYCTRCGQKSFQEVMEPIAPDFDNPEGVVTWLYYAGVQLDANNMPLLLPDSADFAGLVNPVVQRALLTTCEAFSPAAMREHYRVFDISVGSGAATSRSLSTTCGNCHAAARVNFPKPNMVRYYTPYRDSGDRLNWDKEETHELAKTLVLLNRTANALARKYLEVSAAYADK